jgi:DNA-binding GntR family transcriptional regulator
MATRGRDHAQLSELVATQLREQIVSGKLKPGQFLRIDAIAKSLGVSMTPVREGLLLLQSESFVRLLPRRGFVVNSFTKQDLLDLFWAQATVGAELASRAATRMSDGEVQRLQQLHADYEAAVKAGDSRRDRLGHEFHRAINLAADSPRLALLLGGLARQLPNRFYGSIEGQQNSALDYHPLILQAIRLRDPETAGSLMFRHISGGGEHLVASLERQGIWTDSQSAKSLELTATSAPPAAPKRRRGAGKNGSTLR